MAIDYSVKLCRRLRERFRECALRRPFRTERYDPGELLDYEVTPVDTIEGGCRVRLEVESFVGGGFAGQVYKVKVRSCSGTCCTSSASRPPFSRRPTPRRRAPAPSGRSSFDGRPPFDSATTPG
jgi:hypothetical protein